MIKIYDNIMGNGQYALDLPANYDVAGNRGLKDYAKSIVDFIRNSDKEDSGVPVMVFNLLTDLRDRSKSIEVDSDLEYADEWLRAYAYLEKFVNDSKENLKEFIDQVAQSEDKYTLHDTFMRTIWIKLEELRQKGDNPYVVDVRKSNDNFSTIIVTLTTHANYTTSSSTGIKVKVHFTEKKHDIKISEKFDGLYTTFAMLGYSHVFDITKKSLIDKINNFEDDMEDFISEYTER